eukprot:TRINITY_DN26637_c0_g1_i1.p1 TRINITY_DN26637_c0_g1~~TRINITY_DN26637_c0_g1_i1.p1  ORF type:complete len:444 (+),score=56.79 TRINITY_DN26637_c0_g1_i1:124-1455(+)
MAIMIQPQCNVISSIAPFSLISKKEDATCHLKLTPAPLSSVFRGRPLPGLRSRVPHAFQKNRSSRRNLFRVQAVVAERVPGLQNALQFRKLGDSDLVVSEVTLGTMTWGSQNTEAEAHAQLSYAFDNGVNMLDTAEVYPVPPSKDLQGTTDRFISTWLKDQPRDKVLVATKVAGYSGTNNYLRSSGEIPRVNKENIEESVNNSLKRLGTDYIDLLQVHWPDRYVPLFGDYTYNPEMERDTVSFRDQLEGLQAVMQAGKVRNIGVSNETSFGVMSFIQAAKEFGLPKICSIQNCYSLLVRLRYEVDLVEVCRPNNANVGLLVYSPLAGGALSGKYLEPESEAAKRGRFNVMGGGKYMERYNQSRAREAVMKYVDLARRHGLTPTQLAQAFVRDRFFVTSNIVGATSVEQLRESLTAYTLPRPLTEEITAEIESINQSYKDPSPR